MNTLQHHVISIGLILAAFAIGSSSIVVITEKATRQKIIDNERQTLLKAINHYLTHYLTLSNRQTGGTNEDGTHGSALIIRTN